MISFFSSFRLFLFFFLPIYSNHYFTFLVYYSDKHIYLLLFISIISFSFPFFSRFLFFYFLLKMLPSMSNSEDPYPDSRLSWDRLRMSILEVCIEKHLVPSLELDSRRELVRIGREAIIEEVSTYVTQISFGDDFIYSMIQLY